MCQFGIAHVDSPKGDLDSSGGALSGPGSRVVQNDQFYPYGTTEQYPAVEDTQGNVLTNSAHEYRECSNKGICDRTTGTCGCFEGYEGSACQRASCPSNANGVCSGHGTCKTIQEIAEADFNNIYELWDQDSTMGCSCDPGYEGPDCSQRQCKFGVDPYYRDNNATIRYSNWTYQIYTLSSTATIYGNYSIVFNDAHGMAWRTDPIDIGADCVTIATALESIPNDVIPENSVRCYEFPTSGVGYTSGQKQGIEAVFDSDMYVQAKYTIAFPENPGRLAQPSLDIYLDGSRPTLYSDETVADTLGYKIYPNGFSGEYVDMVPDRCFDVTVTLHTGGTGVDGTSAYTSYLGGLTTQEAKLLKTCLGDSNGDSSDNVEVYNWDYGDYYNPHLIKLQEATQYNPFLRTSVSGDTNYDPTLVEVPTSTLCAASDINANLFGAGFCSNKNPPGFLAVLYYDTHDSFPFRLFTHASRDYDTTTQFFVYTTTGYLNLVNPNSVVFNTRPTYSDSLRIDNTYSNKLSMAYVSDGLASTTFNGDLSCENSPIGQNGARDCFNKGDWAMFLQTKNSSKGYEFNPIYPNLYKVAKIWNSEKLNPNITNIPNPQESIATLQLVLDYSLNSRFEFVNGTVKDSAAFAYKFHPATNNANGGYKYTAPCSGRGICNTANGLCECFSGYSDDDCSCLNALSV